MYCPQCGTRLQVEAGYCPECGRKSSNNYIENAQKNGISKSQGLFGALALLLFIPSTWFGAYGVFTLFKSNCDYVYWNGDAFPSYTESFLCANNLGSALLDLVDQNTYGYLEFSLLMSIISISFAVLGWKFFKKTKSYF